MQLCAQLETAEDRQRVLAEKYPIHTGQTDRMIPFFEAGSLADVVGALEQIAQRRALRERAGEAEGDICKALRRDDLAIAEAVLDRATRPTLEADRTS